MLIKLLSTEYDKIIPKTYIGMRQKLFLLNLVLSQVYSSNSKMYQHILQQREFGEREMRYKFYNITRHI